MSIVLTNGKYYIAHDATGAVIKVTDIKQAQDFYSVERAIHQKNKAPGKCAGYYYIDTSIDDSITCAVENNTTKIKRKNFSVNDRMKIYRKTEGHCYLCGEFVDFDSFEIEHRIPLGKGGTNDFSNTFCSCHICNTMKNSIYPEELMEKITKIFMYQVTQKGNNHSKLFVARKIMKSIKTENRSIDDIKVKLACKLIESVE